MLLDVSNGHRSILLYTFTKFYNVLSLVTFNNNSEVVDMIIVSTVGVLRETYPLSLLL